MAKTFMPVNLGMPAADFRLPATDGETYTLDDIVGEKGTVIVFICNHCPYVIAVIDRVVADARVLMAERVGFAAICSNDTTSYHYFGRFTHAAACCKSIFDNGGIAAAVVDRRV